MCKNNVIAITIFAVILIIIGGVVWKKQAVAPVTEMHGSGYGALSGDTGNFISIDLPAGDVLKGIVTVTGSIKGSYFFEANARGMLLDANKNVLKSFPITATSDWMTADAVAFAATVDTTGIAPGSGYFRIMNDNPSGDPTKDKFIDISVLFQ